MEVKLNITLARILEELKSQKLQKKDLAEFLDIGNSIVSAWLDESTTSYKKYLYQIADFLNVDVAYLQGKTDIKTTDPYVDNPLLRKGSFQNGSHE